MSFAVARYTFLAALVCVSSLTYESERTAATRREKILDRLRSDSKVNLNVEIYRKGPGERHYTIPVEVFPAGADYTYFLRLFRRPGF